MSFIPAGIVWVAIEDTEADCLRRRIAQADAALSAAHQRIGAMRAEAENLRRQLDAAQAEIAELKQELKQTEK